MRDRYKEDPESKRKDCYDRRQRLLNITLEIKAKIGCQICKESDPCCLDFHHVDPSKKDLAIAKLVSHKSKVKMLEEIKKCIVVCANCHRKIHANRIKISDIELCCNGSKHGSDPFSEGSIPSNSANFSSLM